MIPTKPKPCKSKCGQVGLFNFKTKGMCNPCYYKWLYGTDEGRLMVSKALEKARKAIERKAKKEVREAKQKAKLLDSSYYKKLLQDEVQKIARLIDYGCKCLARDAYAKQMHGGHVLSRGAFPSCSFNLHNIFTQSAASNHWQNDDGLMKEGLIRTFGSEYADFNNSLKQTPTLNYSPSDFKEKYQLARKITSELKTLKIVRTPEQRIQLRNEINLRLGIYSENFSVFKK